MLPLKPRDMGDLTVTEVYKNNDEYADFCQPHDDLRKTEMYSWEKWIFDF